MNKHQLKFKKTSEKMCCALIDLLKEKRVDEVSVTEICIVADVNRSTFYAHFETIGDLLSETKRYILDVCRKEVLEQIDPADYIDRGEKLTLSLIRDVYLEPFLLTIRKHRDIFTISEFSQLSELFNENENNILHKIFMPDLAQRAGIKFATYLSTFFFSGVDSVTQRWLEGGCVDSVDEICEIIMGCMTYKFE